MSTPAKPTEPTTTPAPAAAPAGDTTSSVTVDDPATGQPVTVVETKPQPKVISVPTSAMKKIKDEAAAAALTARQQELDADAQELGFKDHASFIQAQKEARKAAATAATAQTEPKAEPKPEAKGNTEADRLKQLEEENATLKGKLETTLEEKKRLNRQHNRQMRELQKLRDDVTNQQTESELKLAAQAAGVIDTDYAVSVYTRAIQSMSEEELKGMDESKFFGETMRKTHPHLYAATERPINTGTKNDPVVRQPATGGGGDPPKTDSNGKVDARKMTPQEFSELLQKRGISAPTSGGGVLA